MSETALSVATYSKHRETILNQTSNFLIAAIFAFALCWNIATVTIGWKNGVLDQHALRQAQTAITALYLQQGGSFFHYETPVLGPPWSVPFELPVYQAVVAVLSSLFKTELDQTGRLVNLAFFYGALIALWMLLAKLEVARLHRLILISVALVSPLYVFWSRSFMIESTAVFFGMGYVLCGLHYLKSRGLPLALLGGLLGALSICTKVTTFPGFAALLLGLVILELGKRPRQVQNLDLRFWGLSIAAFAIIPLAAGLVWTRYTDQIKLLNPAALALTSDRLFQWNFGNLGQRLSAHTYQVLLKRTIPDLVGGVIPILLSAAACLFVARQRRKQFLLCLMTFMVVFLLFTNLHLIHNYYTYANGLFLVMGVSIPLVGLVERGGYYRIAGLAGAILSVALDMATYRTSYYPAQTGNDNAMISLGRQIQQSTRQEDVLLIVGLDWNSELAYYARRRSLTLPNWIKPKEDNAIFLGLLARLREDRVGGLVLCGSVGKSATWLLDHLKSMRPLEDAPVSECSAYVR